MHACFLQPQSNIACPCLPSKTCPRVSCQPSMSMQGSRWEEGGRAPTLRRRRQSCSAYSGSSARAAAPVPPSSAAAAAASDLRFFFLLLLAAAATDPSAQQPEEATNPINALSAWSMGQSRWTAGRQRGAGMPAGNRRAPRWPPQGISVQSPVRWATQASSRSP
jgi:hypothetical protein